MDEDNDQGDNNFVFVAEDGILYTKICFSNQSFCTDAANVARPIISALKRPLREVDLSNFVTSRPEEKALEVMTVFSSTLEGCVLKYLNLSDKALGEKGVRAFRALLKSQIELEELYLMNDGISEKAAKAVREFVPSTEKLKILHFHSNMSGDEGATAIAEIVKGSPILEDFRCSPPNSLRMSPPPMMPCFLNILLGNFTKRLSIPILQSRKGRYWKVEISKIDEGTFLWNGWKKFANDHSLTEHDSSDIMEMHF